MKHVPLSPSHPLVALVGRPNVGKSTLFNRLVGRRLALVYDQPGVTRDRLEAPLILEQGRDEHAVRLVDTAGLLGESDAALVLASQEQTLRGLDEAALAVLVVDGRAGCTPFDVEAARLLRRRGRPFVVVVNKLDMGPDDGLLADFHALNALAVLGVSAEHARGIDDVRAFVAAYLDAHGALDAQTRLTDDAIRPVANDDQDETGADGVAVTERIEWHGEPICVAVVGRPNAGKSSLINAILQDERMVASPEAGTTRDAIDSHHVHDGQPFVLVDTAGIRRSRKIDSRLEAISVSLALRSVQRADVVVLMLNGTERPSEQDAKIAALAEDRGKGLVLVASQWDRIENPEWREQFPKAIRHDLGFVSYAPLVMTSAITGQGLDQLFQSIIDVQRERHRRIGTGALNRFFGAIVSAHPPPMRSGKRPQLSFVSQPMVKPPTFIVSTRRGGALDESYKRFLVRQLRNRYGFVGTPLWVKFRAQSQGRPKPI